MQGLLIKQKPLRDLLVSSAYFGGSGQSPIVSCLTHQEVLRVLVTNGGMQLPFLAVTWRVQPYNESSAFLEHVPVYVKTYFIRYLAAEYVTQKPDGNFNQTPPI